MPSTLFRDELVYAIRALRRSPLFVATAVVSLSLTIGATAAIFDVLQTAVFRDPPWPRPDQLYVVGLTRKGAPPSPKLWSVQRYQDFRNGSGALATNVAAFAQQPVSVSKGNDDRPLRLGTEAISQTYLATFGVAPAHGRAFSGGETDQEQSVALISTRLWRQLYQSNPAAIGDKLLVSGYPARIVGILPDGFNGPSGYTDVWVPLADAPSLLGEPLALSQFYWHYTVVVRVRGETSAAALKRTAVALEDVIKLGAIAGPAPQELSLIRADAGLVEPGLKAIFTIVLGAAACALLLVSVNLASLSVARMTAREAAFAVRAALGASEWQLGRILFVEAAIVGLLGVAGGLIAAGPLARALWTARPFTASNPGSELGAVGPTGDVRVVLFTAIVGAAAIALTAALPWLRLRQVVGADGRGLQSALAGTRGDLRGGLRARKAAAVAQMTLAFALGIDTLILAAALHDVDRAQFGFRRSAVLAGRVELPRNAYSAERAREFVVRATSALSALPGVQAVGIANSLPLDGKGLVTSAIVNLALPTGAGGRGTQVRYHEISPGHLAMLGSRMIAGRELAESDPTAEPLPVVVNRTFAMRYWNRPNVVGEPIESIYLNGTARSWVHATIVGVVDDVQYGRPGEPTEPDVFVSALADAPVSVALVVRGTGSDGLVPAIRRAIQEIDPALVWFDVRTMERRVQDSAAGTRFSATIIGAYASVALVIAMVGVYAVLSSGVARRTREFGIKIALGATPQSVVGEALREGLALVALGVGGGVVTAAVSSQLLGHRLYGIRAADPTWYAVAIAGFFTIGVCACLIPAMRAARIDPTSALRAD